jgi:hypothetical protein
MTVGDVERGRGTLKKWRDPILLIAIIKTSTFDQRFLENTGHSGTKGEKRLQEAFNIFLKKPKAQIG